MVPTSKVGVVSQDEPRASHSRSTRAKASPATVFTRNDFVISSRVKGCLDRCVERYCQAGSAQRRRASS